MSDFDYGPDFDETRERMIDVMMVALDHDATATRNAIAKRAEFGMEIGDDVRQAILMVITDISGGITAAINHPVHEAHLGDVFMFTLGRLLSWVSALAKDPIPRDAVRDIITMWAELERRSM